MRGTAVGALATATVIAALGGAAVDHSPALSAAAADLALPLAFEPNRGQTDASVRFLVRTTGSTVFLTREAAVLSTRSGAIQMRLIDATGRALRSEGKLPGTVNYLRGPNRSRWVTNVPTFRRVVSRDVYRGIDLVWYGSGGRPEFDLVVAPFADPRQITLGFEGTDGLRLNPRGDLILGYGLRQLRPVAYQQIEGVRQPVSARYVLANARVRIALGAYDHSRSLVIDPQLVYSTYLGGDGYDLGGSIAVGVEGNAYAAGYTESSDFPTTPGSFRESDPDPGTIDVFVTKLSASGSELLYSTYLGGTGFDNLRDIAVDAQGSAYVVGHTAASDFPTTPGAFQSTDPDPGSHDAFVVKLNPSGSDLEYGTYLGGTSTDVAHAISVDRSERAYLTGSTSSPNFPTTPSSFQPTDPDPGGQDSFVTKLTESGSALVYSTYLGGVGPDQGQGLALGAGGTAYIAGLTRSQSFPTTPNAFAPTDPDLSGPDGYAAKLDGSGSTLVYSTYLGGTGEDNATSVAAENGRAYVVGHTGALDFPTTPGAFQSEDPDPASSDGFVTALNQDGSALFYSTYLGGNFAESMWAVAVRNENAFVTGATASTNFPTTPGSFQPSDPDPSHSDAYLTRVNRSGSSLRYSTYLGGTEFDAAHAVALYRSRFAFLAGQTRSTDFPTRRGAFNRDPDPATVDVFVTKLNTGR